jgi:excisionase family DNA binding protein
VTMTRAPSDLAGLRTLDVATLSALAGGHSPGTASTNGRARSGRPRGATDAQSPAFKRLYTLKEAAHYLAVSYGKVRGFVERGLLPVVKLPGGKLIHVTVDDLERLVLAHREPGR